MTTLPLTPAELRAIILSHGWYRLAPLTAAVDPPSLVVPFDLPSGRGCLRVAGDDGVRLAALAGDADLCRRVAGTCLSLDVDLAPLRRVAARSRRWRWLLELHAGRFLRSPSLYEDLVKIALSMNTTFRRTEQMVAALVEAWGETVVPAPTGAQSPSPRPSPPGRGSVQSAIERKGRSAAREEEEPLTHLHQGYGGQALTLSLGERGPLRAFPRPERLVAAGAEGIGRVSRCGYRAKFLHGLARAALAEPALFLAEGWWGLSPADFAHLLRDLPGLGPVAVGYISRMYGEPAGWAVDAWVARRGREEWGLERREIEPWAERRYRAFGPLGPTVFWLELTRGWHRQEWDAQGEL